MYPWKIDLRTIDILWNTAIIFLFIFEKFCYTTSDYSNKDFIHQEDGSFWKQFLNKTWLSRNSHQRKSFTIFNAISSLFTTIQNSIFSLMMTNRTYCTYIPLITHHPLVLEYVNAAVSVIFTVIKILEF